MKKAAKPRDIKDLINLELLCAGNISGTRVEWALRGASNLKIYAHVNHLLYDIAKVQALGEELYVAKLERLHVPGNSTHVYALVAEADFDAVRLAAEQAKTPAEATQESLDIVEQALLRVGIWQLNGLLYSGKPESVI
jgi:hypothetical protein